MGDGAVERPPAGPDATRIVERQRRFFRSGATRDLAFRKRQLAALRDAISARDADVLDALKEDLGRPSTEAYLSEVAVVLHEITFALKRLDAWARPRRVRTPLIIQPGTSRVHPEPYGTALIISPWNYPFQLAVAPLVAALAAGNCAIVKPSEIAPRTSAVIADLIANAFDPDYVSVLKGGAAATQALLRQPLDYVFDTGGAAVGRVVMEAAAKQLTPVTLELGGKNPCIVDEDADLDAAARRIAWGKFLNAGQTCIAPDFVLAHAAIKPALLQRLPPLIERFYGRNAQQSPDYDASSAIGTCSG